jgi:biotin carboxylase
VEAEFNRKCDEILVKSLGEVGMEYIRIMEKLGIESISMDSQSMATNSLFTSKDSNRMEREMNQCREAISNAIKDHGKDTQMLHFTLNSIIAKVL